VLNSRPPPRRPGLWDGRAGQRIAAQLLADSDMEQLRPTAIPAAPLAPDAHTLVPASPGSA